MPELFRQAERKIKESFSKFLDLTGVSKWSRKIKIFAIVFPLVLILTLFVFNVPHAFGAEGLASLMMDEITMFLNKILFIVAYFLGWVVTKFFGLLIYVSSYNDFITNPVVSKGWYLVRDLCNMFFVVAMLIIAFAEILGMKNYGIQSYLPKVIKAAILVNFSKLICGLFIDASQVVMMTFVNGYQATAGANLVVGLGFGKLMNFNNDAGGQTGVDAINIFVSIGLAILFLVATAFFVLVFTFIFIMRIIMLWLFVVISPVFFMADAVPILGKKVSGYADQFINIVMIGPLMAFFLWLSLLIMSNPEQNFLSGEGQVSAAVKDPLSVGALSSAGSIQNIMQFSMGLGMLVGGLTVAMQVGGTIGGVAKDAMAFGKKQAMAIGKKAASPITTRVDKFGKEAKRIGAKGMAQVGLAAEKVKGAGAAAATMGVGGLGAMAGGLKEGYKAKRQGASWAGAADVMETGMLKRGEAVARQGQYAFKSAGSVEKAAIDKIDNEKFKERLGEANQRISTMGIKDDFDAQLQYFDGGAGAKEDQQALALSLASSGKFQSKEQVEKARSLLSGDKESLEQFNKQVAEKQAHLAYNLDDVRPIDQSKYGRQAFEAAVKKGKINIGAQEPAAFGSSKKDANGNIVHTPNQQFIASASSAMGAESFGRAMEKVRERELKDEKGMSLVAMESALRAFESKPSQTPDEQKSLAALRTNYASAGGKVSSIFGGVGSTFNESKSKELSSFLGGAKPKELGKMSLKEFIEDKSIASKYKESMIADIQPSQLVGLAENNDENSSENLSILVEQLHQASIQAPDNAELATKYKKVISNPKIMEKVGSSVASKVASSESARKQAEREQQTQEESFDRRTEEFHAEQAQLKVERQAKIAQAKELLAQRQKANTDAADAARAARDAVRRSGDAISRMEAQAASEKAFSAWRAAGAELDQAEKGLSDLQG